MDTKCHILHACNLHMLWNANEYSQGSGMTISSNKRKDHPSLVVSGSYTIFVALLWYTQGMKISNVYIG